MHRKPKPDEKNPTTLDSSAKILINTNKSSDEFSKPSKETKTDKVFKVNYIDLLKNIIRTDKNLSDEQVCFETSRNIQNLLVSSTAMRRIAGLKYCDLSNQVDLMRKHKMVDRLFSLSDISEHSFFIFTDSSHSFSITKKTDSHGTRWNVFQSDGGLYSLGQWMSPPPLNISGLESITGKFDHQLLISLHEKYGQGKDLTADQVSDFIQSIPRIIPDLISSESELLVSMYPVDPKKYAELLERQPAPNVPMPASTHLVPKFPVSADAPSVPPLVPRPK